MDSQVSTNYEPSVSVAGDGDASVSMEPEGVTMASSISAAIYEPSVWMVILVAHGIVFKPWNVLFS